MSSITKTIAPLLFLVIVSFWPWMVVSFEVPKVIAFGIFVAIWSVIFAFDFLKNKSRWDLDSKLVIIIFLFLFIATLTSVVGFDITKSFLGNFYRRDGLLTLYELAGFSLLVSYYNNLAKVSIPKVFFWSSFVVGLISIFEMLFSTFGIGHAGTFGNPVYLSGFLAISIAFSFYLYQTSKNKLYLAGIILSALVVILSGVLGGIITVLIYLVLFILLKSKLPNNHKMISIFVLTAVVLVITSTWIGSYISNNKEMLIFEGRGRIFISLFNAVIKRPIGYGWSNVDYAFLNNPWPIKLNNDIYLDKAHSEIVEVAVSSGIVGLVVYLGLILYLLVKAWNRFKSEKSDWNFMVFSTLCLFVFHSQTNIISIVEQIIFWYLIGVLLRKSSNIKTTKLNSTAESITNKQVGT